MATRFVFTPQAAEFPTSNYPQLLANANNRLVLAFDASTDQTAYWTADAPQGLTGTITVVVFYTMASATTGSVRFQAAMEAITPGDAVNIHSSSSFDTANSAGGTVPATAGYLQAISLTMTNADSIAAGDLFRLGLNRDADSTSGTDDAALDCYVISCELRDTA